MIIRQGTVNLARRAVRMLALDLISIPVVSDTLEGDLENFRFAFQSAKLCRRRGQG